MTHLDWNSPDWMVRPDEEPEREEDIDDGSPERAPVADQQLYGTYEPQPAALVARGIIL